MNRVKKNQELQISARIIFFQSDGQNVPVSQWKSPLTYDTVSRLQDAMINVDIPISLNDLQLAQSVNNTMSAALIGKEAKLNTNQFEKWLQLLNLKDAINLLTVISEFQFNEAEKKPNAVIYDNQTGGFVLYFKASLVSHDYRAYLQKITKSRKLRMHESEGYLIIHGL